MSKSERVKVQEAADRLANDPNTDGELKADVELLRSYADSGIRLKKWSRRFLLGFGLAAAIEDWFAAFDERKGKPLLERLPRDETSNVAAKWAWYSVFTSMFSAVASVSVAALTVVFLSKQIGVLNEGNDLARQASADSEEATRAQVTALSEANNLSQQAFYDSATSTYMTHLYDEKCVTEDDCGPLYNSRIREASLKGYVDLEKSNNQRPNLFQALLLGVNLADVNLDDVDLSGVRMSRAIVENTSFVGARLFDAKAERLVGSGDFTRANLAVGNFSGSHLKDSVFVNACLAQAKFNEADLRDTDFSGAKLTHAYLIGADLSGAKFSGAILTDANFSGAIGMTNASLETACRDERTELPEGINVSTCREPMRTIDSCKLLEKRK